MRVDVDRRRVLLAARPSEAGELLSLFLQAPLQNWDVLEADSFERSRFLLQHNPCDAVVVDEGLYYESGPIGLAWLARQREAPTVFLTGQDADTLIEAYSNGVDLCLPRQMILEQPAALQAALQRVNQIGELTRSQQRTRESLHICRRQVDRLVNLLWRTAPMDLERQWLTQRHILERLQEEVARSGRHGSTFSLAIGEVQGDAAIDKCELAEWTAGALTRAKRRCDVAGHYGLQGFLLLMVQTPKSGGLVCCQRLQRCIEDVSQAAGPRGPVRAYFGLSSFTADNSTPQSLLSRAEMHLEAAKTGASGGIVAD
jgi:PleD family two-component response regulator